MRAAALLPALAVLALGPAACGTLPVSAKAQRQAAEQAVVRIVTTRNPDVAPAPVANCVIDSATEDEVTLLAEAAERGISGAANATVTTVLTRPATRDCLASAGAGTVA